MPAEGRVPFPAAPRHGARDQVLRFFAGATRPLRRMGRRRVAVRRVLLIRPDHLGDFLFATPALERWRCGAPPGIETVLSIGPWNAELAAHGPLPAGVETYAYPGFARQPKEHLWSPYVALLAQAAYLRQQHFDVAVLLRFDHWWGGLLAYLAGIPLRVGYAVEPLRGFLTDPVPYVGKAHEVERNLALVERVLALCGQGTQDCSRLAPRLIYHIEPAEQQAVARLLADRRITPERPLIALHPGAGAPVKFWPAERFAALADALNRRYGAQILLTGGPAELPLAWRVAAGARAQTHILAGRTDLPTLAALLASCDLVIGADSGPLHLATAVGAPTVHLYGPSDPALFGPWSARPALHRVVLADCACAPCDRLEYAPAELARHDCMASISVERVLAVAEELLDAWHFRRLGVE